MIRTKSMKDAFLVCFFLLLASSVSLKQGELTLNGSITSTHLDFTIEYTDEVQWLALIWSQSEVNSDVTLFKRNKLDLHEPVTQLDCYLDQNSFIQIDAEQNLLPTETPLVRQTHSLRSTFKKPLFSGDTNDITLHADTVIKVCFIWGNEAFQGNGYETGNQKICSYISLEKNKGESKDRILGDFPSTPSIEEHSKFRQIDSTAECPRAESNPTECQGSQGSSKEQSGKTAIWLDCDPGLDDAFALIYAGLAPELNLLGVSASPGNTNLQNTIQNSLDILYNIGRSDVPVFAGSNNIIKGQMILGEHIHGANGLGGVKLPTSPKTANIDKSFEKIYERIKQWPTKITWLNTGSLTNLCIILLAYPDLIDKFDKIVMMGGAMGKGNITPAAEFNVFFDPHAFEEVLRLKKDVPLYMIPLEVTHQNLATQDIFDHLHKNNEIPFSRALYNMLLGFKEMYWKEQQFPYPPVHDPLTVFYVLHPEEIQISKSTIDVDTMPVSYGRTNVWPHTMKYPGVTKQQSVFVATNLKNEKTKFWDQMLKILDHIFSEKMQGLLFNE